MLDGLVRAADDGLGLLAAERVLDDQQRQAGDAECSQLTDRESLEGVGPDEAGGRTEFRDLDGVVETPRRAGPSIAGAGEDHVARLR